MWTQFIIWSNRAKKFKDYPLAIFPFLRKYVYYNYTADSYIPLYRDVHFLGYADTINEVLYNHKSIARFGDDVFDLLLGIGLYFGNWRQVYRPSLAKRLKEVLSSDNPKLLLCFNPEFILKTKTEFKSEGIIKQYLFWTHSKVFLKNYIRIGQSYGSALSFHERYNAQIPYEEIARHLKTKHLIVVASNTARFKEQNLGLTTQCVEAPSSNAWDSYEKIMRQVIQSVSVLPK